jgi:Cu+-exporting ATPase
VLSFLFNGIGVPLAATGLVYPVGAMIVMVVSVTAVLANSVRVASGRRSSSRLGRDHRS